ncbi:MAG TPA: hypothetical protein VMB18_07655 [Terriglobales bacterium]|nr:hypothetical protein [Terriglobales bacterium]
MTIDGRQIHRDSGAVIVLSLIALLAVVSGYFQAPQPDERSSAHIFQLSVVLLAPMILIFLSAADWTAQAKCAGPGFSRGNADRCLRGALLPRALLLPGALSIATS